MKLDLKKLKKTGLKWRILLWCAVLALCAYFSLMVLHLADKDRGEYQTVRYFTFGTESYALSPGSTAEQHFTAQGRTTGENAYFYLQVFRTEQSEGTLTVRLHNDSTGEIMIESVQDFCDVPVVHDLLKHLEDKNEYYLGEWYQIADEDWYYRLKSGEKYRFEIINQSAEDTVYLLGNNTVQAGKLTVDGEPQKGFLNVVGHRKALYTPSRFLLLMILITDFTVLLGLALVLFTDVKVHTLYLILAIGFGIVTLFDLTPIYGFDMRFQFDSTYVVSNRMLGLDGTVMAPAPGDEEKETLSYYRRACDDYSMYQFYKEAEVSANYTDMKAGLRNMFASEADQELQLVATDLGFVGEQLYLYIPQAIGFAVARLLGLGMYPMLMLARVITYAIFVAAMYVSIRNVPFGSRILLVIALSPTVLVQTVSITRDAMIMTMAFYVISKVLQVAYAEKKPGIKDWVLILAVSTLLAPCKMIYLPVSFFWLLIVYRHDILGANAQWKKALVRTVMFALPILAFFVLTSLASISDISQKESTSVYGTEAYSVHYILTHIPQTLFVAGNTFRIKLGEYLMNAIQLWNIDHCVDSADD